MIIVETKSDENPKVHNTGHRVVGHGQRALCVFDTGILKYDIKNMKFILILISDKLDSQDGFLHKRVKRCYDNR